MNRNYSTSLSILAQWCTESSGRPLEIAPNNKCSFKTHHIYSVLESSAVFAEQDYIVPRAYSEFLATVGSSDCFLNEFGLGIKFHKLEYLSEFRLAISPLSTAHLSDLILIASLTGRGDIAGFSRTRHDSNFAVFSCECPTELWNTNESTWTTFETWIVDLVNSFGEKDLP